MFTSKFFLLSFFLFICGTIYFVSSFPSEPSIQIKEEVISIAPIVIPPNFESDKEVETLLQLKQAVNEASFNDKPSEEEEALEVLQVLGASLPPEETPLVVKKKEVLKEKKIVKKDTPLLVHKVIKKAKSHKKKLVKKEKKIIEKEKIHKKKLAIKEKKIIKKEIKKKIKLVVIKEKVVLTVVKKEIIKSKVTKKEIFLGEHNDLHTLSKEEMKKYQHLEVVTESKPFKLDNLGEIKSPKQQKEEEKKIELDELPFVQTLGVVSKSNPFLQQE